MKTIIHAELLYIKKSDLPNAVLTSIRNRLSIKSVFDNRTVVAYAETDELIGVPRYFRLPFSMDDCDIQDYRIEGRTAGIEFTGKLREYQVPAIEKLRQQLSSNIGGNIINAQTGSGKTVMALKALSIINRTTLIIVPKSDLMEQWTKQIIKFTNLTQDDIGYARQGVCDFQGKKVVIGMLQSLCKDRYPDSFKQYFGLLVADEVHRLSATEFSKAALLFPAKYRLGLSASLDRKDGTSVVFFLHLSANIITVKPSQPKPDIHVFNYAGSSGKIPKYLKQSQQRRGSLISMLAANKERTRALAILTMRLSNSGRQTAVLSERKILLEEMKKLLVQEYNVSERLVGIYIHKTPKKEKERILKECTIILATTKMLAEGTDIPKLRAIVFATPLSDVLQPVGRIRRIDEGCKSPLVLDFVDTRYRETIRWFQNRRKWYNEQKFKLNTM
jgi:superfamily II DNA or RNA helicase